MWKIFKIFNTYEEYLINVKTGEVHLVNKITGACGVQNMAEKNKLYASKEQYSKIEQLSLKLNGCIHCNKDKNTD